MIEDLQLIIYSYLELEEALLLLRKSHLKSRFGKMLVFETGQPYSTLCNGQLVDGHYEIEDVCFFKVSDGYPETALYILETYEMTYDSIFIEACKWGYLEIIRYIFSKGFIPTWEHTFNNSLMFACRRNHIKIVKYLVNKGIPVNQKYLDEAVRGNALDVFKYLLDLDVSPNLKILELAVEFGYYHIVKHLLELGLKPTPEIYKIAEYKKNPEINKLLKISCCVIL